MANSSLNVSSLDFDTLKSNLKAFLSNQSVFKDYDFEGSNINVLLDVLSYNSYLNSFYLNMVASEMFLDSAQKYDTVVSHAKELNYVPISTSSSQANISVTFETVGLSGKLTVPKGTRFSGTNSNNSFEFVTRDSYVVFSANNTYQANLEVYEGSYFQDSFIFDTTQETLLFKLSNKNIDLDSLTVKVTENNGANVYYFSRAENLFRVNKDSEVFFVQAADNNLYEILFGDDVLGRKPQHLSTITAEYIVNNGKSSDGVTKFGIIDDISNINYGRVNVPKITTLTKSSGGSDQESLTSVKYNAPRHFAAQYRAISTDDYASIILSKFGGRISDIVVYGGQELEPKQYGRVVLSLKYAEGTIVPDYIKNEIQNYLLDYVALPNRVIIKDPEYLYCKIDSIIQYDKTVTTKFPNDIKSVVLNAIKGFSEDHLEKFGKDFRYSKFVAHIDNSDTSITSNNTEVKIIKKIYPLLNFETSYVIEYNNAAEYEGIYPGKSMSDEPVLTSSGFTYVSSDGTEYTNSYIQDNSQGTLIVYTYINSIYTVLNDNIGTIDYDTGIVKLNKLKVSYYSNNISLYLNPRDKDIIINKSKILLIDLNDVNIELVETVR